MPGHARADAQVGGGLGREVEVFFFFMCACVRVWGGPVGQMHMRAAFPPSTQTRTPKTKNSWDVTVPASVAAAGSVKATGVGPLDAARSAKRAGTKPPVVLLHGFDSSCLEFRCVFMWVGWGLWGFGERGICMCD